MSELNTSVIVPTVSGLFSIAAFAASGVKPLTFGTVYRSGPLETINLTLPPASTLPPPSGID